MIQPKKKDKVDHDKVNNQFMTDFRNNLIKLLPIIISSTLTIIVVGGGFFLKMSERHAYMEAELTNLKETTELLREDIEQLDDEKVNNDLFMRVMKELQRMNSKLDELNTKVYTK